MPTDGRKTAVGHGLVAAAGEMLLAALALFAMDGLAHLRLSVPEFLACWSAWPVCRLGAGGLRRWSAVPRWLPRLVEMAVPGLVLNELDARTGSRLTLLEMAYAVGLTAVLIQLWRLWLRAAAARGLRMATEALRLLLVGAVGLGVTLPLFTDCLVGGVDARWYACMLGDFITQWRAGVFPVFLGQGELAYNGAVHPFRSAPFFQYLGGFWDTLTLHTLAPVALQHLTAITVAMGGALGMYLALAALAPGRRWTAAVVAAIYVTSPALLAPLYLADQYMTFMTVAMMPAVLYGNLRLFQPDGDCAWPWLAAGLALVWLCHPPVAILCTLATAVLQGGRLLLGDAEERAWWNALGGAVLFLLLSCFYFVSMAEVPSPLQPSVRLTVLQTAGAALALAGIVRGVVWRQPAGGLALLAGGALLGYARPAWLGAAILASAVAAIAVAVVRRRRWGEPRAHGWIIVVGSLVLAGGFTPLVWGVAFPPENADALRLLHDYSGSFAGFFMPVGRRLGSTACQPGWGAWALLGGLAWGALVGGSLRSRLTLTVAALLVISCLAVPGLSAFWVAFMPRALVEMVAFPLVNRLFPVMVAMASAGGFLWLDDLAARRPGWHRALAGVLVGLALWGAGQTWPFLQHGWATRHTRQDTADLFRPDSVVLERVAYDLLPIPFYVSNGKVDPRLESRVWIHKPPFLIGPDGIAHRMEAAGGHECLLTATVDPTAPAWLKLAPEIQLAPGERVLLRFEFLAHDYRGWLVFKSEHIYRNYLLPDSGWPLAFGVGRGRSKVVSLWNSGATEETVRLSFQRTDPAAPEPPAGDFARLHVSPYRPELAPVRTLSLIPYRVEVDLPTAGWVETPRVYLPGYAAVVDGHATPVNESLRFLVRVPVAAGRHVVEVDFRGTPAFWAAWWVSAVAWAGLAWWWVKRGLGPAAGSAAT